MTVQNHQEPYRRNGGRGKDRPDDRLLFAAAAERHVAAALAALERGEPEVATAHALLAVEARLDEIAFTDSRGQ